MCNEFRRLVALGQIRDDASELRIPLRFPEGAPNLAALASIRITDPALILRAGPGDGGHDALQRRWSWAGSHGRPVYNVRSEGQSQRDGLLTGSPRGAPSQGGRAGRCLIPADGFYEFTAPEPGQKRKTRWLFTHATDGWFAIGGVWRGAPGAEAFALLTCEPGPDVAPYHPRQIVIVPREGWARWLDPAVDAGDLARSLPAGTLAVARG